MKQLPPGLPVPVVEPIDPASSEFYRVLFSSMERRMGEKPVKSIAVTSAVKGEGKTTTAIQLARVSARDFGKRILLMEGDLKNPQFHRYWTKTEEIGLYHVLTQQASLDQAIHPTDVEGLEVMPLGTAAMAGAVNASLLAQGFRGVVQAASGRYDYVVVDSPPVLPLVDMRIIAEAVDGVVMVIQADGPPRSLVAKALEAIPREKVLGVVFNGVTTIWPRYTYGYTY